jgi:hypothetical protein
VLAGRSGVTQGRTSVVSVRGVLRGFLVLVESRLTSLVGLGRKRKRQDSTYDLFIAESGISKQDWYDLELLT